MRIDRAKLKKSLSDPPADCALLIQKLCAQTNEELCQTLSKITTWTVGKCELYHWVAVLDRFDTLLEKACSTREKNKWQYLVDENNQLKELVLGILNFTALLIEYSCSRHIYGSIDHIITLLCVADLDVTLSVLNLLYVFSKRSTFLTRLSNEKRQILYSRLEGLAESWGGKDNGFGLAECCDANFAVRQRSATTVHFEFRVESAANKIESIYVENVSDFDDPIGKIMETMLEMFPALPKEKHMALYTRLRLAHSFGQSEDRLKCVQVRLHAISVLVFLSSAEGSMSSVLYSGFVEEIVDLLKLNNDDVSKLIEIKAAALRTLTSIVHFDCPPRLSSIIDATGSSEYHGFLPTLIRNCIQAMTQPKKSRPEWLHFPHSLSTALFSFLYHLSSYDNGAEALVNSGMIESLLKVIRLIGDQQDQIMFVTRAVRIVDLVTNVDMQSFQTLKGIQIFVDRLEHEVDACRKDAPLELTATKTPPAGAMETEPPEVPVIPVFQKGVQCMPQRSALLKSILNFLKKTITDQAMAESVRHIMETSLPKSLRHVISNCEYYGASLFLLAMEVIQIYVFQEPSLLSNMQETGLTDVILQALLVKEPPSTKEVLANMPNIFTALCLNESGLKEFIKYDPFDKMFKVLICQEYLQAMKRRRSSDAVADTPAVLGSSVDELMRHQNSLRLPAIQAIIKLLKELVDIGNNPETVSMKVGSSSDKNSDSSRSGNRSDRHRIIEGPTISTSGGAGERGYTVTTSYTITGGSSGRLRAATNPEVIHEVESQSDDDTEETMDEINEDLNLEASRDVLTDEVMVENEIEKDISISGTGPLDNEDVEMKPSKRNEVPLMDYILNVCKFLENMLSNNNTADHCRVFIKEGGLQVLIQLISLRALPIDFATSTAAAQIAAVLRIILVLSKETTVLEETLKEVLNWLEFFEKQLENSPEPSQLSPSLLLRELLKTHNQNREPNTMPVMLSLSNIHSFVWLFHQMCNNSMQEVRIICVKVLGGELGLKVISKMANLCRFLIWENTILTSLSEANQGSVGNLLGHEDFMKLAVADEKGTVNSSPGTGHLETEVQSMDIGSPSSAADGQSGTDGAKQMMDEKSLQTRQKLIKTLPQAIADDLGNKLSNLFSLLVKMSVGASHRNRPGGFNRNQSSSQVPSENARAIANELSEHTVKMLKWEPPISKEPIASTKYRFSFFICGIEMCSKLIMDQDTKSPFHLMLQHFLSKDGIKALETILYEGTKQATGFELSEILTKDELPEGCAEFMAQWLALIEKMVDTNRVTESRYALPSKYDPDQGHVPFRPGRYLACVHQLAFKAVNCIWGKSSLKGYAPKVNSPKLLETLLAVLRHVIKSEEFVRQQTEKENKEQEEDKPKRGAEGYDRASKRPRQTGSSYDNRSYPGRNQLQNLISELTQTSYFGSQPNGTDEGASNSVLNLNSSDDIRQIVTSSLDRVAQASVNLGEAGPLGVGAEALARANGEVPSSSVVPPAGTAPEVAAAAPPSRNAFVDSLVGMGYSERLSLRAVQMFPNSNEQAVEYCLANQDQDELEMAIQMSLQGAEDDDVEGEDVEDVTTQPEEVTTAQPPAAPTQPEVSATPEPPQEPSPEQIAKEKKEEEKRARELEEQKRKEIQHNKMVKLEQMIIEPIKKDEITQFTNTMIPGCLQLLDDDPETVYRISDLLIVTIKRNGTEWMQKMLKEIVQNIQQVVKDVFNEMGEYTHSPESGDSKPKLKPTWPPRSLLESLESAGFSSKTVNNSRRLSTGLLLLTLLFEEAKMDCVKEIDNIELITSVLDLLEVSKILIDAQSQNTLPTPNWEIPIGALPIPKWISSALLLIDLYQKTTISDARRKMVEQDCSNVCWLYFDSSQAKWNAYNDNDQETIFAAYKRGDNVVKLSSSRRKYTVYLSKMIQINDESQNRRPIMMKWMPRNKVEEGENHKILDKFKDFNTLNDEKAKKLISCCVSLMNISSIDSDTLHSCMRILLRLTRDHEMARWFANCNGLESLFKLKENQGFNGFYSLVSLLIRHILESPDILQNTVEKTIRQLGSAGSCHHLSGISQNSLGRFEFNYVVRCLGPVACRNPAIFVEALKSCLKIQLRPQWLDDKLAEQDENDTLEGKQGTLLVTSQKDLNSSKKDEKLLPLIESIIAKLIEKLFAQKRDEKMDTDNDGKKKDGSKSGQNEPLLTQNILLRILGEIVTSYPRCASSLTAYKWENGETTLHHVLDNLLMNSETGKPEILAQNFLSCFANCDSSTVQKKFVIELKSALNRVLEQPESLFKHQHLRALLDLITSSVEAGSSQKSRASFGGVKEYNQISYLMVKHGLALDLSKLTYSLDLSSPHLAPTINANLKALEILSKVASYSISSRNQFNQDASRPKEKEGPTEQTAATEGEEGRNTSPETLDENPNQFEPVSQTLSQSEVDTFPEYEEPSEEPFISMPSDNLMNQMEQLEEDMMNQMEQLEGDMINREEEVEEEETEDIDDGVDGEGDMEDENPESDNSEDDHSDDDDDDDEEDDDEDGVEMGWEMPTYDLPHSAHRHGGFHDFHGDRFQNDNEFLFTIDEFMYPPSGNSMRRPPMPPRNFPFPRMPSTHARLHRFNHTSSSPRTIQDSSSSILQPLPSLHPLLNRSADRQSDRQGQDRSVRDSYSRRGNAMSTSTFFHPFFGEATSSRSYHRLFPSSRMAYPFSSPPRGSGSTGRNYRQDALVFEDLVPDNMWSNIESGQSDHTKHDNLFPSAFFRWAEETAVLDGSSMHDLILLLKPYLLFSLRKNLEVEIAKRKAAREERRKKEAEKKDKKKEADAQVNLTLENDEEEKPQETPTVQDSIISAAVPTISTIPGPMQPTTTAPTPGQLTPGTPTNTPNTTTGNTPTHTNTHTPATSEPNTRPDSPVGPHTAPNHDDQLQAVSEELDQHQQESEQEQEQSAADENVESMSVENAENNTQNNAVNPSEEAEIPAETAAEAAEAESADASANQPPPVSAWNIDPTFLAALPDEIRGEVIRDQANQVTRAAMTGAPASVSAAVPAEFLEALPENIRNEVRTAHERAQEEVRRQQQQQQAETRTAAGDEDPAGFIRSLEPRLRQQTLMEMDPESINRLPTDLATEARNLQQRSRTALEERQRHFLQNRTRISRRPNFTSGRPNMMRPSHNRLIRDMQNKMSNKNKFPPLPGKFLIDSEALSCLVVLLFINDGNIQQSKLHKVLRHMFIHREGRKWITSTLLAIINKAHEASLTDINSPQPQWLSLKLEASLGARHGVFHLDENTGLNIHSQAASYVCRATLDSLIFLAKLFPKHFVSGNPTNDPKLGSFWDVLMKLEHEKSSSGKSISKKPEKDVNIDQSDDERPITTLKELDKTVFAKMLRILNYPVIRENRSLIDKMLNLLASVASQLPVLEDTDFESEILKDEVEHVVEILTSHLCSDEGLEDCTEVLIALSMCHLSLRIQVLRHLLKGAAKLGESLKVQISQLLSELRDRNSDTSDKEKQSELQLPAMQLLTSKTSNQAFFLRILKVIVQLRKKEISLTKKRFHYSGRDGGDHGWRSRSQRWGFESYQFDETINNAIHAAITRNSPDATETVIHVLEGMATVNRDGSRRRQHEQEALLGYSPSVSRSRLQNIRSGQPSSSGPAQPTNKNSTDQTKQAQWKEQENKKKTEINELNQPLERLLPCQDLWDALSNSLLELDLTRDNHAFLVLQPAVEAFFIVHASHLQSQSDKKDDPKEKPDPFSHINSIIPITPENSSSQKDEIDPSLPENEKKFVKFAEKHRAVLNQILRQSNVPLSDGPFAVLTKHIKILDFDVKRRFFRQELDKIKEKNSRGDMAINVSRNQIFDDSFRELHRKSAEEWKSRLYIVFDNEDGQDAGGLLREWFLVISRQMFNPNYALFQQSPTDKVTYRINPLSSINSNHKLYFNFVGRVVAKAIYDNKLLECYFTRAFYKHILGVMVTYKDMESEDYSLYQSLVYMLNNPVTDLGYEITFSIDVEKFGETKTVDLKENGRNIPVTDENKMEYVQLVCQQKLTGSIREQLRAFLEGFYDIVPKKLVSIFDEQELELLISGLPKIDIDDLKANTEYHKYQPSSLQIQWFWRALKSFDESEKAKFLQFVTGTSKVPLQGFAHLEGMNGTQKFQIHRDDRETTRLPCAHTCFNQLDLPAYENYDFLRSQLLLAINEGSEGFGLA